VCQTRPHHVNAQQGEDDLKGSQRCRIVVPSQGSRLDYVLSLAIKGYDYNHLGDGQQLALP